MLAQACNMHAQACGMHTQACGMHAHKHAACMQKGGYAHASMRHACASMLHARRKVPNACLRTLGQLSTQQACSMLARACRMHAKRFQMHVCRMLAKKYAECMLHACETCMPLWFGLILHFFYIKTFGYDPGDVSTSCKDLLSVVKFA